MATFFELYKNFPKTDCGYCGSTSCVAALRRHCAGEMPLSDCIYFKTGMYDANTFMCPSPIKRVPAKPGISYVNPCPSESGMVTVEVSLASDENLKYGCFDIITADKIFGQSIQFAKFSPSLGLARFEADGRAVMAFSEGRVLVRRAPSREDAFWQLSRYIRMLWAAAN